LLGKRVAIKVLSFNLREDKTARRRFVREARAASAIDHPNIVHVFDVDMDNDPPYLVMEFVDGISLQAAVAGYGTFSGGEAAAVGAEVARGLAVAAKAGLVHRDIKPANLLLDRRGGVKILDLGIVRLMGDDTQPPGNEAEEILGTLDYLAPEQAKNPSSVDARADLYALGATLYFLLAGHPPFPGTNLRHKLVAKQFSDPPPIHRLRPDVEVSLSDVIHKLLARDPASRYLDAAATAAALSPFAALPADFPTRLFRPLHPSTVADGAADDGEISSASPTQSIRKGTHLSLFSNPLLPHSPNSQADEPGPPTLRLSKALTDLTMDALLSADQPSPHAPQELDKPRVVPGRLIRVFGWILLGSLAAAAVVAIVYASIVGAR
jgi:eukaryotic-like serine/threonine-protein kinase